MSGADGRVREGAGLPGPELSFVMQVSPSTLAQYRTALARTGHLGLSSASSCSPSPLCAYALAIDCPVLRQRMGLQQRAREDVDAIHKVGSYPRKKTIVPSRQTVLFARDLKSAESENDSGVAQTLPADSFPL
eukprot:672936-Rhodomonas_salina.2